MAITYPMDLLSDFPGWSTEFELVYRQEQSRQANGVTRVKDMGSPIWRGAWQSRRLKPSQLDYWRARLDALEGGLKTFRAWSSSRCFPIHDPSGTVINRVGLPTLELDFVSDYGFAGVGYSPTLYAIGANRNTVRLAGLPVGYRLGPGDMIRIGERDLHRIVEPIVADAQGRTPEFEVRPHLWPGVAAGAAVSLVKPYCIMTIVPGSVSTSADSATGWGVVSFQGMEAR